MSIYGVVRSQWAGVDGSPKTQVLSVHSPLMNRKVGLGLQVVADQIGPNKNSGAFASYAYRIHMKKSRLALGIRAGTYTYKYDQSLIKYKDPSQNELSTIKETHFRTDFGIYYNSRSWYWGWSIIHLVDISPSANPYFPSVHRYLTVGKAFQATEGLIINPSILMKNTDETRNTDINLNFLVKQKFWAGFSLRKNTIPILFQYIASDQLKIGFSWDVPAGKVIRHMGSSWEVLLQWDINIRKTKTLSPRYL